jgi:ABC-type multidrug transport system fused ATPase/permease subunit
MPNCSGSVEFKNVTFAYDGRQPTLRDISFTVKPGTSTAIVGESGSGKSTCLKLLYRFYDTTEGVISIDDLDLRDLKTRSFRKHIGVVPQDSILFNTSILYNLQYAKPDATLEEIYDACRTASIHEKIMAFPEGYETKVGERGLRLSGGEKQRVSWKVLLEDVPYMYRLLSHEQSLRIPKSSCLMRLRLRLTQRPNSRFKGHWNRSLKAGRQ